MTASSLVEPAFRSVPSYAFTLGPEVGRLCELAGFAPDLQQQLGLDVIFARREDKRLAAQDFAVIAPRQNLKTGLFKQTCIGWLWLTDEPLIVWSAHEYPTSVEAFEDMAALVEDAPILQKRLHRMHTSPGREAIELKSGARLKFRARRKTAARGLSAPKLVLDEAFALHANQLGSLLPLILAQADAQVLYGSSACLPESDELFRIVQVGRAGMDASMGYLEWCDNQPRNCALAECQHHPGEPGCVMDDLARWYAANPSLGRRLPLENVQKLRIKLPAEEFGREILGWHDESASGLLFDSVQWSKQIALARPDGPVFAVDMPESRRSVSIGGAAADERGPVVWLEDQRAGTGWVVDACNELDDKYQPAGFVIDQGGPAAALIPDFLDAGLIPLTPTTADVAISCQKMVDLVKLDAVRHMGSRELDMAVVGCQARPYRDGGFFFGRRLSDVDISPLVAVTLALWGWTAYGEGLGPGDVTVSF